MNDERTRELPIGLFDSGVGGLTVLRAVREALPGENLLYLGDTARLPYGTKSPQSIIRYAGQATRLLQARGIKLLVVACNTASAVALDALTEQMAPLPVVGVVEPGAAAAVETQPGGTHLVLATETTVRLGAYARAIARLDASAEVRELACEILVAVAEEGWIDGEATTAIVRRYLSSIDDVGGGLDSVILGCTHFPLLRAAIAEAVADPSTAIVDSAGTTAAAVRSLIAKLDLGNSQATRGSLTLLATDGAARFARVGGRFLGEPLDETDVKIVDL